MLTTDIEPLWEIDDVATYLHISVSSVYKMTARKARLKIPHVRIGRNVRFRRADIDRWVALLTVSNVEVLETMRRKSEKVRYGTHSQKEDR